MAKSFYQVFINDPPSGPMHKQWLTERDTEKNYTGANEDILKQIVRDSGYLIDGVNPPANNQLQVQKLTPQQANEARAQAALGNVRQSDGTYTPRATLFALLAVSNPWIFQTPPP